MVSLSRPLIVFAVSLAMLWLIAYADGFHPWLAGTWARWDSAQYLDIAKHGYELHRCSSGWCGNTAWFPGYPILIAALQGIGLPALPSAVAISWALDLGALVLLWRSFLSKEAALAALGGLAYAAWAPGQVYEYAVFPLSLLFLLTVLFLRCLDRRAWLPAGLAAAGAVATYPSAVALAAVAAAWSLLAGKPARLRAFLLSTGPMVVAVLLVFAAQRLATGRWSAFFDVQHRYEHGFHDPVGQIWNAVLVVTRTHSLVLEWAFVTAVQTLIVTAILGTVVVYALHMRRRAGSLNRRTLLFLVWGVAAWALPLVLAHLSVWRSQAALAPLAVLVARLPRTLLVAALLLAIAISVPMARLFFGGALV